METAYLPSSAEPLPFWAAGRTRCLAMSFRRYGDIMGAVVAYRSAAADVFLYGGDEAAVAERLEGFDPRMAQQLAVVPWLRVTGQRTDD